MPSKEFTDSLLLLTPQTYLDALMARSEIFAKLQEKISAADLSSDEEKMLHVAIQGYFREWLVSNNHQKKLSNLLCILE